MFQAFKSWFSPAPTGVSHIMTTPEQTVNKISTRENNWRTGMWVVHQDKIAILHAFKLPNVELHYVSKEDGTTLLVEAVDLASIRQATYNEIPPIRRADFPIETARRLGYGA